jgi:hypothetical protein
MNPTEILKQVKVALGMEIKLEQMKLEDGITIVEAEKFEPEFSIGIATEEGIVPMPIGEYVLENGQVVVVEVEGIIKEVAEKAAEEVMPEAEHPAAEITEPQMEAEQPAQPKRVVESVSKETFFALQEKLDALEAELAELKAPKVELAAEVTAPIQFNPENKQPVEKILFSQQRKQSTKDLIYKNLFS